MPGEIYLPPKTITNTPIAPTTLAKLEDIPDSHCIKKEDINLSEAAFFGKTMEPEEEAQLGEGLVLRKSMFGDMFHLFYKGTVFVYFDKRPNGAFNAGPNINSLGTIYPKEVIKVLLWNHRQNGTVRRMAAHLGINLDSPPTQNQITHFNKTVDEIALGQKTSQEAEKLTQSLNVNPGPKPRLSSDDHLSDPARSRAVLQRQAIIAERGNCRWLFTTGAGPCAVLTLYDPISKRGAIAHIDSMTTKESIAIFAQKFSDAIGDKTKIQARMISGESLTAYQTYQALVSAGLQSNLIEADLDVRGERTDSIALDLETGLAYDIDGYFPVNIFLKGGEQAFHAHNMMISTTSEKTPLRLINSLQP